MDDQNKYYLSISYKDRRTFGNVARAICALLNSANGTILFDVNEESLLSDKNESKSYDRFIKQSHLEDGLTKYIINRIRTYLRNNLLAVSINDMDHEMNSSQIVEQVINSDISFSEGYELKGRDEDIGRFYEIHIKSRMHQNIPDIYFCFKRKPGLSDHNHQQNPNGYVYDYYFMNGNKVVRTDERHLCYFDKVVEFGLPAIKEYEPFDSVKKTHLLEWKNYNNVIFELFGELPRKNNPCLYKYMDLESALLCLEKDGGRNKEPNIRFVEPTSWEDQYEGRFYNAEYKLDDGKGTITDEDPKITPFLYACCFSSKSENEAAWVLYSHNRTGLASRCVQFALNKMKLRENLVRNLKDCSIYIGAVQYESKMIIDHIHENEDKNKQHNKYYDKYFNPLTLECYLNLLLLKRFAFEHEEEVRIFIVPKDAEKKNKARRGKDGKFPPDTKPDNLFVNIDWMELIEEIKLDTNCTEYEKSLLNNKIAQLLETKKKEKRWSDTDDAYIKLKSKLLLKDFDPYKDDSLAQGPITIVTNKN